MNTEKMTEFLLEFQKNDPSNRIPAELAKKPEYAEEKIMDGVLAGVAAADDEIIASYKGNETANLDIILPGEWLPGAKTVVSFFLPYTHWIVDENSGGDRPCGSWLHGRIEGQAAMNKMSAELVERIREEGFEAVSPVIDPRMKAYMKPAADGAPGYTSSWSERHIAYAAGLGTFGISRNLITERGSSGRLFSIITNIPLEITKRYYTGLYDNCIRCGSCVPACPVSAISVYKMKEHPPCDAFLNKIRAEEDPYYGCGKCQCGMPCSYGIPDK